MIPLSQNICFLISFTTKGMASVFATSANTTTLWGW